MTIPPSGVTGSTVATGAFALAWTSMTSVWTVSALTCAPAVRCARLWRRIASARRRTPVLCVSLSSLTGWLLLRRGPAGWMMGLFSVPFWLAGAQLVRLPACAFVFSAPTPRRPVTRRSLSVRADASRRPRVPRLRRRSFPQTKQTVSPLVVTERIELAADGRFLLTAQALKRQLASIEGSLEEVSEASPRASFSRVFRSRPSVVLQHSI